MRGEGVFAEDFVHHRYGPVRQGRLFNVADAVDLAGDPVVAVYDVLGGLGVGGVYIVHQGRSKQRTDLNG